MRYCIGKSMQSTRAVEAFHSPTKTRHVLQRGLQAMLVIASLAWSSPARTSNLDEAPDSLDLSELTAEQLDAYALDALLELRVTAASQHEIPVLWSPSAISVYQGDEIRASGAPTLADFLRRVPGMDVHMMESAYALVGTRSAVDLGNNRLLLTIDGREEVMEMVGMPVWTALSADLEEIERIEVVRGPASTLYGPNAFLGVVAVTTVKPAAEVPPGTQTDTLVRLGSLRSRHLFARTRHTRRLHGGRFEAEAHVRQAGLGTPSDPEYLQLMPLHVNGRLRFAHDAGATTSLFVGGGRMRFALPTPWGEHDMRGSHRFGVLLDTTVPLNERWQLVTRGSFNRYTAQAVARTTIGALGIPLADPLPTRETMLTGDGQLRLNYEATALLLTLGAMLRYTLMRQDLWVPTRAREIRAGLFGHAHWRTSERTQIIGGLRLDLNTTTAPVLTPRLVFTHLTSPQHALRVAAQLGFRKPFFIESAIHPRHETRPEAAAVLPPGFDVTELLDASVGNPELRHETVQSLEAGWWGQFRGGTLDLGAQLFLNRLLNVITVSRPRTIDVYLSSNGEHTIKYVNAETPYVVAGAELEARWRHAFGWRAWANMTARHGFEEADKASHPTATIPRLRINVGGGYAPARGPVLDLAVHYVSPYEAHFHDMRHVSRTLSQTLGNKGLLFGLLAYRFGPLLQLLTTLEVGATVQLPVPAPHREYLGIGPNDESFDESMSSYYDTVNSDLLAEEQTPRLSVYVRARL